VAFNLFERTNPSATVPRLPDETLIESGETGEFGVVEKPLVPKQDQQATDRLDFTEQTEAEIL